MAPLKGVKVYVDVRSSDGKANYSLCVREQLELLGAEIHKSLTLQCTHVVFKDGKMNTRLHANKLGLTLVNVLWVERCRETNSKCDEVEFPVTDDRVETPVALRKTRPRYRSLQPAVDLEKPNKNSNRKTGKKAGKQSNEAPRRRSSRISAVSPVTESGKSKDRDPHRPKDRLNRKLQWPPDHSDVCSEAEIAAHMEISQDLKDLKKTKGKRKLKKDVFLDTSMSNSQNKKSVSATNNFVVKKTPASKQGVPADEEDSQMSLYDASQHFERKDYSITNIINRLDTTIEKVSDIESDLSSDSDDLMYSPAVSKRTCLLTNSQKNVMDRLFEFDEVDEKAVKPKRSRKKVVKKLECKGDPKTDSERILKDSSPLNVLPSPNKMLTFNSNYNDNTDIITELDAVSSGAEELLALKQIKSPAIVKKKKRRTVNSETSITIKISNNNVYTTVPNKTLDVVLSKDAHQYIVQENLKMHKEGYDEIEVKEFEREHNKVLTTKTSDEIPEIVNENNVESSTLFEAKEKSESNTDKEIVTSFNPLQPVKRIIEASPKPSTAIEDSASHNKSNNIEQTFMKNRKRIIEASPKPSTAVENSASHNKEQTFRKNSGRIIEASPKPSTAIEDSASHNKSNNIEQTFMKNRKRIIEASPKPSTAIEDSASHNKEQIFKKNSTVQEGVAKATVTLAKAAKILQEPEITSTSETKENTSDNKSRRVSKRLRHSSAKLRNPDFVYEAPHSMLGPQEGTLKTNSSKLESQNKKVSNRSSTISSISANDMSEDESFKPKETRNSSTTRRSDRKRRTNPKYAVQTNFEQSDQTQTNVTEPKVSKQDKIVTDVGSIRKSPAQIKIIEESTPMMSECSTESLDKIHKSNKPCNIIRRASKRSNKSSTVSEDTATEESDTSQTSITRTSTRKRPKKSFDTSSESLVNISQPRSAKQTNSPVKMICTTCCHRDDQAMVRNTAKMLTGSISESVTVATTHVVMGTPKRTINLLKAVIHGAHVISLNWVTDSISSNSWLKENKYSLSADFPILKMKGEARRDTAAKLFSDIGLIFIEKETTPPQPDLVTLVELCGGKVTRSRTRSRYCIGGAAHDREHISLSEQWILDSITNLKIQNSNRYLLYPFRSPSPEF